MRRSGSAKWLTFLAVCVALLAGAMPARAAGPGAASSGWPADSLGEPVHRALSTHQAFGLGPGGEPEAFFVNLGNYSTENAELVAVDLRTQKTVTDMRLPAGYSITGIAYSQADGAVFIAPGTDHLFEYQPGGGTIEDLGAAIGGQTIWSLATAPDGTVWGGTYPGGHIFSYSPSTRAFHDYGQALAGETYVTSVEPTGGTVYFGTQPDTELGALDPGTGQVTQIPLPAQYQNQAGDVDALALRGTRLFVVVAATFSGALVWDTASRSWVATISDFSGSAVSPVDPTNADDVYFRTSAGNVVRYDLSSLTAQPLDWAPNGFPGAFAWVDLGSADFPGQTLMFTYYTSDRIYGYNLAAGKSYYLQPSVQGAGDQLIVLGEGPDGNVYAGAYLTPPGMGVWHPGGSAWQVLTGSGQVEGYGSFDGNLVFGRYPQGALYYYDLSRPWSAGTNPGTPVNIGDDQNRPVAFTEVGGQMAVGSVPVSGRLGGDISLWNPSSGAIAVYSDVVHDQTPVSLVTSGGLVWGGTSIDGGYGVQPTATSAELFAWDPATHQVVYQTEPLPKATNVSGLALDGAGHLWGLADSTLFEFDLASRTVMRTEPLASAVDGSMYGLEHQLVFDKGRLFATTDGALFHVDTVTWKAQQLYSPASNLTQDRDGRLYFIQEPSFVYRYDLPVDTAIPTAAASVIRTPGAAGVVSLSATEPGGVGVLEIDYRVGDGPWQVYQHPFPVLGHQTVSYRAVDRAWSASAIRTVDV